jgi:hypothetical protein
MKRCVLIAVAALMIAGAESAPAAGVHEGDARKAAPQAPKAQKAKMRQAAKPRVYGTPIQPPIMKKRAGKRTGAVAAADPVAKKKAATAAKRRAQADLERRRANPAAANGPR